MLSEEEKKAIERLKERINDSEDYKTVQVWLTDDVVAVNTVLNLITKLQKENEEKDKQIDLMAYTLQDNLYLTPLDGLNKEELKQYFEKLAKKGE